MANRFFRNTGSTAWGTDTNWSTTDGGTADTVAPTSADTVLLTSNSGNISMGGTNRSILGFNCTGYTGTFTWNATLTINGSTFLLSAGMTVVPTSGGITISSGGSITMTSNGKFPSSMGIVVGSGVQTITLADNFSVNGFVVQTSGTKTLNGNTLTVNGNFTLGVAVAGTTNISLAGTGTWSGNFSLSNNLTISGTYSITGTTQYQTGILTNSGSTTTHTGLLSLEGDCTLNTAGIVWNNVQLNGAMIITNNSLMTINGTLTHLTAGTRTWTGTAGFTANTWTISSTTSDIHNLKAGLTYTVTNIFQAILTDPSAHPLIKSGTGGTRTNLTISRGSTCTLGYVDFTDVDASGGRKIDTFNGVTSNCLNIKSYQDPSRTIALSFAA